MNYLPQIIYLTLVLTSLFLTANMHNKPRKGKYNFFATLVAKIILLLLLYWGGFFK